MNARQRRRLKRVIFRAEKLIFDRGIKKGLSGSWLWSVPSLKCEILIDYPDPDSINKNNCAWIGIPYKDLFKSKRRDFYYNCSKAREFLLNFKWLKYNGMKEYLNAHKVLPLSFKYDMPYFTFDKYIFVIESYSNKIIAIKSKITEFEEISIDMILSDVSIDANIKQDIIFNIDLFTKEWP